MENIKNRLHLGTMLRGNSRCVDYLEYIAKNGFESCQFHFWEHLRGMDLPWLSDQIHEKFADHDIIVSALGVYGNPLKGDESAEECLKTWYTLIDSAPLFGTDIVCGFTGRLPGKTIPDSLEIFKKIFIPICEYAGDRDIRIAFENCSMDGTWDDGDWNIAICPEAWELIFESLPFENVGLEWEPGHAILQFADPLKQLKDWMRKIFHIHGKDGSVDKEALALNGISGSKANPIFRLPGYGDTNWKGVIDMLIKSDFSGSIDIEGFHDPVFNKEQEWQGQAFSLEFLKKIREEHIS
ncbi:MAG: sugar phosphate isomerase/epimerase [Spirochaetales bacterium]|nr:sugar phosphate isomerase/epimerase [Spirochaetales bacterium]